MCDPSWRSLPQRWISYHRPSHQRGPQSAGNRGPASRDPGNGGEPDRPVRPLSTALVGVNLRQLGSLPVSLLSGRFPAVNATDQVDVTQDYLSHLGLPKTKAAEVVGTQIMICSTRFAGTESEGESGRKVAVLAFRWTKATVVGVVQQEAAAGDVLAWPPLAQADFEWVESGRALGDTDAPTSPYVQALVVADQLANVESVRAGIAEVGYTSSAQESIITAVGHYLHVVEIVLSGIGVVALAIAALGIANALMAAVRERRREIGVLKAIGARDRDVMRTFLVEAGTLGFVGGVLGTALGGSHCRGDRRPGQPVPRVTGPRRGQTRHSPSAADSGQYSERRPWRSRPGSFRPVGPPACLRARRWKRDRAQRTAHRVASPPHCAHRGRTREWWRRAAPGVRLR